MRRLLGGLLALALVLAGCTSGGTDGDRHVPDSTLPVNGGTSGHFDTVVRNALDDVIKFWQGQYPALSGGKPLPPLSGGLYSVDASQVSTTHKVPGKAGDVACIKSNPDFIIDNAAYCAHDDSIEWDRADNHLLSVLAGEYGDLLTVLVFAHEFSHSIQAPKRLNLGAGQPVTETESQADCSAGAFIASAAAGDAPHFHPSAADIDRALTGFLLLSDTTPTSKHQVTHGNGFDRISAFVNGFESGEDYCFAPSYYDRTQFTILPWHQAADYGDNGNETLEKILNTKPPLNSDPAQPPPPDAGGGLEPDLDRFWGDTAKAMHKSWKHVPIKQADHPPCDPAGKFDYCPSDNTVYYDRGYANTLYDSLTVRDVDPQTAAVTLKHKQPADFALGTMFAVGWALAARHQFRGDDTTGQDDLLGAICMAGSYVKDINLSDRQPGHEFILSPPDMDEATFAVLTLVNQDDAYGARGTTGLQRVQSFIDGYWGGVRSC